MLTIIETTIEKTIVRYKLPPQQLDYGIDYRNMKQIDSKIVG